MEISEERLSVFEVGYELEFTVANQIGHLTVTDSCHCESSRTDLTNGEGSDAIGTSGIEHLGEGRLSTVAVTENGTSIYVIPEKGYALKDNGFTAAGSYR